MQKNGQKLSFSITNNGGFSDWVAAVNVIQTDLKAIGIQVTPKNLAAPAYQAAMYNGNYQLGYYGARPAGRRPYYELRQWLYSGNSAPIGQPAGSNFERYSNSKTDALINEFPKTTSTAEEHSIVNQLQQVMLQQVPVIPITEQVDWFQYNTGNFNGWVTKGNPYAQPAAVQLPGLGAADAAPVAEVSRGLPVAGPPTLPGAPGPGHRGIGPADAGPASRRKGGPDESQEHDMRFALRRLGFFAITLWAALTLNFFLPRLMPGNPAEAMMGKFRGPVNPQALKALEAAFGVSTKEGLFGQYFHYLGDVATGKFGTSLYFYPQSVGRVILDAIPWTLGLVGVTTVLAFLLGTGIGIVAAWRRGGLAGQHRATGLRDHLGHPVLLGRDDADPGLRGPAAVVPGRVRLRASTWPPASTWRSSGTSSSTPCCPPARC